VGRSALARSGASTFVLHFLKNGQEVRTHEIRTSHFTIGSADDCTVRAKSTNLAPLHATVLTEDGQALIAASPGLTVRVNGQPTERCRLASSDVVRVGPITFSLEVVTSEPTHTRPVAVEDDSDRTAAPGTMAPSSVLFSVDVIHPQVGLARYDLGAGTATLGRSRESALVLDDPAISRQHALLMVSEDGVMVRDLGSAGGTFLNGRRISEEYLKMGDVLGMGSFTIVVRAAPAPIHAVTAQRRPQEEETDLTKAAAPPVETVRPRTPPPTTLPPAPRSQPGLERLQQPPRPTPQPARATPQPTRATPPMTPLRSASEEPPAIAPVGGSPVAELVRTDGPRFAPRPALDTVGFLIASYPAPVASKLPPVLEVSRVWNDEALELRQFVSGSKVTIGSKRGTYVLDRADVASRFPLVASERGHWILSIKDGWSGFVDAGGGPQTRVAITDWVAASGAQADKNGVRRVVLTEGTHVALDIGDFTLLLRLVRPEVRLHTALIGRFDTTFASAMALPGLLGLLFVVAYLLLPVPAEPPIVENPPDRFVELLKAPPPPKAPEKKQVADEKSSEKSSSKKERPTRNDTPVARTKQVSDIVSKLTKKPEKQTIDTAPAAAAPVFNISGLIGDLPTVNVDRASTSLVTKGGGQISKGLTQLQASQKGPVRGQVTKLNSSAKVTGSLSREDVSRVVNEHSNQLTACYEKVLMTDPGLAGKITLDWTVKMDGLVKDVRVASSTLSNPKVAVCVVEAVKGWKFPKPVGGEALISYPFLFRSSG
jgi:predicted component of type VI protein secretion system